MKRCSAQLGRVRGWWSAERGLSEVASAIFVLPVMAFLIFALVDLGVNMNYRTRVDNITQSTVRAIAQDGGLYWSRTTKVTGLKKRSGAAWTDAEFTWSAFGRDQLLGLCGNGDARCTSTTFAALSMVCTVSPSTNSVAGSVARQVATQKNATVRCTSRFPYKPVSPLSNSPATSLGFSAVLTQPITSTVTGYTTVGANG